MVTTTKIKKNLGVKLKWILREYTWAKKRYPRVLLIFIFIVIIIIIIITIIIIIRYDDDDDDDDEAL